MNTEREAFSLNEIVNFLVGSAPLDGVWFGEIPKSEKGVFWWRKHLQAALAHKQEASEPVKYAEVRKCENCWHVGVDDRADGIACCGGCGWSGDEPKEDKCPACERENHMMAACPNCNEEYHLVEEIKLTSTAALQKRIEELEALVFADKPLSVDDTRRIFREWEHAEEIPHGLYARFKLAESAKTALKEGDVQAPNEGEDNE